jgi:hypothetical protein
MLDFAISGGRLAGLTMGAMRRLNLSIVLTFVTSRDDLAALLHLLSLILGCVSRGCRGVRLRAMP